MKVFACGSAVLCDDLVVPHQSGVVASDLFLNEHLYGQASRALTGCSLSMNYKESDKHHRLLYLPLSVFPVMPSQWKVGTS